MCSVGHEHPAAPPGPGYVELLRYASLLSQLYYAMMVALTLVVLFHDQGFTLELVPAFPAIALSLTSTRQVLNLQCPPYTTNGVWRDHETGECHCLEDEHWCVSDDTLPEVSLRYAQEDYDYEGDYSPEPLDDRPPVQQAYPSPYFGMARLLSRPSDPALTRRP